MDGGEPDPFRTRAFLMRTAATAMIGRALGDAARRQQAAKLLQQWTADLERNGLGEYNSPAWTTESVAALQWVWQYAPDEATRERADAGLRYLYADLLQHYHSPSGFIAGAQRAALPLDYTSGLGPNCYLLYALYGTPELGERIPPYALFTLVHQYEVPPDLVAAGQTLTEPRLIRSRSGPLTETATYLTPRYSLGTMAGWAMADSVPLKLTYTGTARPTAYFLASPVPAWVSSLHNGSRALVSFHFDQVGTPERLQAWVEGSLGSRGAVDEVWVDQTPVVDTDPTTEDINYAVAVGELAVVATRRGDVYTAVMVLECGLVRELAGGRPGDPPGELGWQGEGETAELVLRLWAQRPEPMPRPADNLRVGLLVEVATKAEYPDMAAFAEHMYAARARYTTRIRQVQQESPGAAERERGFPLGPIVAPRERAPSRERKALDQTISWWNGDESLILEEDLNHQEVLGRWVNEQPFTFAALYRSPLLNQEPGDPLASVFRPPPPEPVAAPETPPSPDAAETSGAGAPAAE